ncbi:DNA-binding protein [Sulfuricystis multivorans]|uniref:DNA-binding protein n=1 Tax=Sulfuricystis multivorans TaxID=2211108 RepID=UPI000F843400|nr:DNA-binding protein [Sulfuricystis multivorans]
MFHDFLSVDFHAPSNLESKRVFVIFDASYVPRKPTVPQLTDRFSAHYCSVCYHSATMGESTASKRSRHSYRERIQEVIQERMVLGKPLTYRDILKDAGGGSASTVAEELAKADRQTPATLVGRGAKSLPQRIAALEDALNSSLAREKMLMAENQALKEALTSARADVDKLLAVHQDAQRMLLQGVDDLRQMVKAGQGIITPAGIATGRQKTAGDDTGDGILWKARHDQLLQRFAALDAKNRKMSSLLHDLGVDVD